MNSYDAGQAPPPQGVSQMQQPLTPQQAQLLSAASLGSMEDRNKGLDAQMQMANAMRGQKNAYRHSTPGGALMAGIGDSIGEFMAARQARDARDQQQHNFDRQDAERQKMMAFILRRMGGGDAPQAQPQGGPQFQGPMEPPPQGPPGSTT